MFKRAVKHQAKLRLAIAGPSGSGKTYTSLAIATALANGGGVAVVDTEHGSASKYADVFEFDVAEMHAPFHPDKYVQAIGAAVEAGYKVVVLDSMSHAWSGEGGLLDIVDSIAKRMKNVNSFAAWKDATPIQNRMIEALLAADIHLIATMRSKQEYVLQEDSRGKSIPRKVGMAPIQRDGFEYEFDVFLDMDIENNAIVSKTRCSALVGGVFAKPGADVAGILRQWLQGESVPDQTREQEVEIESPTPPAASNGPAAQNRAVTPAPPERLSDDELVIFEAHPKDFYAECARFVPRYDSPGHVMGAARKLTGRKTIPAKPEERLDLYRRIKAHAAEREGVALLGEAQSTNPQSVANDEVPA